MRVTQSMRSGNLLHNLNSSYSKMSDLQNQLDSGLKINRPSDAPAGAVRAMGHRRDLARVEQYNRNMSEVRMWQDATNTAFMETNQLVHRVQELVTYAATDGKTDEDRKAINKELEQLRKQLHTIANTEVSGNHIFSGTNVLSPLFDKDGNMNALPGGDNYVEIEIFNGIKLEVNTPGATLFKKLDDTMDEIIKTVNESPVDISKISSLLGKINNENNPDSMRSLVLSEQAKLGALQNRAETMEERLSFRELLVESQMRDNESVDYAKTITNFMTQKAIHQAGLSVGAQVIQPTLVDFIR